MRWSRHYLALVFSCLMVAPPAWAQRHIASQTALDRALAGYVDQQRADRETISRVLHRDIVSGAAVGAGLDVDRLDAAVSTLDGPELQRLAQQARDVDRALAGGASVTLSVSTIIIIALFILLLVAIA